MYSQTLSSAGFHAAPIRSGATYLFDVLMVNVMLGSEWLFEEERFS